MLDLNCFRLDGFCCKLLYVAVGCVKCYLIESNWSTYYEKTWGKIAQLVSVASESLFQALLQLDLSQKNKHPEDEVSAGELCSLSPVMLISVLGGISA